MQSTINNRHLNSILIIVLTLGTATLAMIALAAVVFAAILLHTALDAMIELVQTITGLYTHGDALTRLVLLLFLLFVSWKAAPRVVRYIRREIAAAPFLFMHEETVRPQGHSTTRQDEQRETKTVDQDDIQGQGSYGSTVSHDKAQATAPKTENGPQTQSSTTQANAPSRADLHTMHGSTIYQGPRRKSQGKKRAPGAALPA